MTLLREKRVCRILPGRERRSVNDSPQTAITVNQRVFNAAACLIEPNPILIRALAPDKPALIRRLFSLARHLTGWFADTATLNPVSPDLSQQLAAPINEDSRFRNLFAGYVLWVKLFSLGDLFIFVGCFFVGCFFIARCRSFLSLSESDEGGGCAERGCCEAEQKSKKDCGGQTQRNKNYFSLKQCQAEFRTGKVVNRAREL